MAPYAVCTNRSCRRVFDFSESDKETDTHVSSLPPKVCPDCDGNVVAWCPRCMLSIANKPEGDELKCVHCAAELMGPEKAKPAKLEAPRSEQQASQVLAQIVTD